ncbi:MAG: zinc finger domain-containing protein [Candidatus Woesearchaeota archaeon]|jgi:predicted RNA-binding Zn-ribbon protein involved in translation (DUF1610 family)|nr:zinc finger domain-containing protein [Candidatus Woesearchaeota archaeon]
MTEKIVCSSCKTDITNLAGTAKFPCPNCAKYTIIRCKHCREVAAKFSCPECKFTGPN